MNLLTNQILVRTTFTKNRERNKAGDFDGYLSKERIRFSPVCFSAMDHHQKLLSVAIDAAKLAGKVDIYIDR